jgi:hypothetical protein
VAQGEGRVRWRGSEPRVDGFPADGLPPDPKCSLWRHTTGKDAVEHEQVDGDGLDGLRGRDAVVLRGVCVEEQNARVRVRGLIGVSHRHDRGGR